MVAFKEGSKPVVATGTEQSKMSAYVQELSKAVNFLVRNGNEQNHDSHKKVSFQLPQQQGMNQFGSSYYPPSNYNSQQNQPLCGSPTWQPRPQYQMANQQIRPPSYLPNNPSLSSNQASFRPPRPTIICDYCKLTVHKQKVCYKFQRILLESKQPPICYCCRHIGTLPTSVQGGSNLVIILIYQGLQPIRETTEYQLFSRVS